jgi:hypothetical protein
MRINHELYIEISKQAIFCLTKKFCAKIADFGLAFLFPDDKTHMSMVEIAGTK